MANLSAINKDHYLKSITEDTLATLERRADLPERSSEMIDQESVTPTLGESELERFLHSTEEKPKNSAGYSPYLTPKGDPVFADGKAYFPADYGTPILHSGPSGQVIELKTVPNGTEREVVIQAEDGAKYTYYGIGGAGLKVGDDVKSGQVLSYTKMHFDAIDSVGVQIAVTAPDGADITESAFSHHKEKHPITQAAEKDATVEKRVSQRSEYSSSDIDRAANQVFAGDRKVSVYAISPTPSLSKAEYRPFKGFDGLGAPSHLANGIVVNGMSYGDTVVAPMAGTIVHQKNEPNDTLAVSLQLENGDIMTIHGLRISPSVGTKVEAGRSLGLVGTTDGEIIISTQASQDTGVPHRPSYYLNKPSLMTASRAIWDKN
jgi:biotin carboxyl carrier protein